MYTQSYLRYLLGDDVSLHRYYYDKRPVSLNDIKRNLLLLEREHNFHIPDHYYRLGQEESFNGIDHISDLFTKGLRGLANYYLELRNGVLYVKAEKMNSWQQMLPYMPPLIMDCLKLWNEFPLNDGEEVEYIKAHFVKNIAFTAYPSAYIPQLNEYRNQGGFTDLHMHLNGALETDWAWQDFLRNPLEVKAELDKAFENEMVKEQYTQTTILNTPDRIYDLLKVASILRYLLFYYAFGENSAKQVSESQLDVEDLMATKFINGTFEELLNKIDIEKRKWEYSHHPLDLVLGDFNEPQYLEGILYIKLFQRMIKTPENDTISGLFHYYLLILGLTNKMLVQQPTCYGFEEFKKVTLNGLREYSESVNFFKRFSQMSGNELHNIRFLEGRFSPKDEQEKNLILINNIQSGWDELRKLQEQRGYEKSTLKLVAHFIKKKDVCPDEYVRYKNLREEVEHKADLLILLFRDKSALSDAIIGIDAASSEFDTPPEVFAPVYRQLRNAGYEHFTYHAGEDFFHILSGLRAIYEAITYLDLKRCDRIGHASVAGVPVSLWYNNIGNRMLIRQGEHLDNLIFAYHLISQRGNNIMKSLLPMITLRIDELSYKIYRKYYPVSIHLEAWKMRYKDPQSLLNKEFDSLSEVDQLFLSYHRADVVERYKEIIEIDTYDILQEEQLTNMQHMLLDEMHDREIVIETLPTSNVVIGNHHDFSTYHLFNWYQWKKQGLPMPPIVIGTDDTGIFATNIYNEYCNVFCQFVYSKGMNADEVSSFIRDLDNNARLYAFQ